MVIRADPQAQGRPSGGGAVSGADRPAARLDVPQCRQAVGRMKPQQMNMAVRADCHFQGRPAGVGAVGGAGRAGAGRDVPEGCQAVRGMSPQHMDMAGRADCHVQGRPAGIGAVNRAGGDAGGINRPQSHLAVRGMEPQNMAQSGGIHRQGLERPSGGIGGVNAAGDAAVCADSPERGASVPGIGPENACLAVRPVRDALGRPAGVGTVFAMADRAAGIDRPQRQGAVSIVPQDMHQAPRDLKDRAGSIDAALRRGAIQRAVGGQSQPGSGRRAVRRAAAGEIGLPGKRVHRGKAAAVTVDRENGSDRTRPAFRSRAVKRSVDGRQGRIRTRTLAVCAIAVGGRE